jgi:signal peptidase II
LRKLLAPGIALLAVVVIDQASKIWAISYLSDRLSARVLGDFFMLTLVYNEGGAMGTNFGSPAYYLISSVVILVLLVYYVFTHRENQRITVPLALVAGGAIGNIIDRLRFGKVVDFLDVDFFDMNLFGYRLERWWTFNLADAAISCSIVFLVIYVLIFSHRASPDAPAEAKRADDPPATLP